MAAPPGTGEPRINDRIRAREVRLVAPDGEQIGIKPLPEALAMARELGLDLVEVADKANPPVCRIMDFGKYKYEAAQRAKESRKKTTHVSVKEMKYRPKIGSGDFDTKTKKVEKFLAEGHRVKLTIMFRGREIYHKELGEKILDQVAERVEHLAKVEVFPRIDGRNMTMVLAPDKQAQAAHARAIAAEAAADTAAAAETAETEPTTEPVAAADADSAEAGEPAETTETTETTEPAETTETTETTEPAETTETTEPSETADATESTEPTEAAS